MKTPNVKCFGCGIEVYIPAYRINTFKYCSRECKNKFGCIQKITSECKICSEIFTHISSRANKAKYCSRKCYHKSQIGKGLTTFLCRHCGNQFLDSLSRERKYCSRKCTQKNRKETFKPSFTTVRKAMLSRDMIKKCDNCGYNEYTEILGIHHIDRNRKNNSKENLQVLCPTCHSLAHRKHISH